VETPCDGNPLPCNGNSSPFNETHNYLGKPFFIVWNLFVNVKRTIQYVFFILGTNNKQFGRILPKL
jgi:hypothetical protein